MPHGIVAIEFLNRAFASQGGDPERVLDALRGAESLPEVYERLEIGQTVSEQANRDLQKVFGAVPASLQAAVLAACTSAVERGLGVTFAWKQSVAFELGAWEAVDEDSGAGGVTLLISTPPGRAL
jgi:hypothetical protein